jgi:hypothetical protein
MKERLSTRTSENTRAFATIMNSDPQALAVFFDSLEHSRTFLLEYLNLEPLFFFLISVEGTDSPKTFICSNFNYVLQAVDKLNNKKT